MKTKINFYTSQVFAMIAFCFLCRFFMSQFVILRKITLDRRLVKGMNFKKMFEVNLVRELIQNFFEVLVDIRGLLSKAFKSFFNQPTDHSNLV